MREEPQIPDWLQKKIDCVIESEYWPNGTYPSLGFAVQDVLGDAGLDNDGQVSLLQMLIDELVQLRKQSACEHEAWEAIRNGTVICVERCIDRFRQGDFVVFYAWPPGPRDSQHGDRADDPVPAVLAVVEAMKQEASTEPAAGKETEIMDDSRQ